MPEDIGFAIGAREESGVFNLEVLDAGEEEGWDSFISAYAHNIFQTSLWARVMREGYGTKALFFILKRESLPLLGPAGNIWTLRL